MRDKARVAPAESSKESKEKPASTERRPLGRIEKEIDLYPFGANPGIGFSRE
jgi:hypothetical protein